MASSHSLKGLMKWLSRDEWSDAFADVLDLHLLQACEATGIDVEEVPSLLDQDYFMSTVWGCAFEDFLTRETEDGRNIVDDYLKRRGWNESASNKSYMSALRTSVISLYEVSNIIKDTSFLARDLVRGGDPILVSERSATHTLKQWDRIAARIVQVRSKAMMAGGVLPFDRDASEELLKVLNNTAKRALKERHKLAQIIGCEADDPRVTDALSKTELLRLAAPVFTTVWLTDVLDRFMHPRKLAIQNADGDELLFCNARFPFAESATDDDIRSALNRLPELRQESATFWNWVAIDSPSSGSHAEGKPKQDSQTLVSILDDGSLVLGNIELKERSLVLSTNSKARSERGRALLAESLGGLVCVPLIELQTVEQLMASRDSRPSSPSVDLPAVEQREIVHATLDKHYHRLLDDPIPVLGNVSPRTAAKTKKGREKVVAWLKTLENHTARLADRNDPMATYDVTWLWTELGVSDLRR